MHSYGVGNPLAFRSSETHHAAAVVTRLTRYSIETRRRLIRAGYAHADAALRAGKLPLPGSSTPCFGGSPWSDHRARPKPQPGRQGLFSQGNMLIPVRKPPCRRFAAARVCRQALESSFSKSPESERSYRYRLPGELPQRSHQLYRSTLQSASVHLNILAKFSSIRKLSPLKNSSHRSLVMRTCFQKTPSESTSGIAHIHLWHIVFDFEYKRSQDGLFCRSCAMMDTDHCPSPQS